ncbi:MAG: OB-fold nucleic acid binding domain-containing protein [Candidatus Lokiarchaeota archaeon]|nr:OB-fold nucleic acid binding domain-containing protein [Candidatus Lokiarchaeota archaeon]
MEAEAEPRKRFEVARAPPARIRDAVGGVFDATMKELATIYGKVKRVQVVAMVIDHQYTPASQGGDSGTKSRLRLTLDDGTGIMAATWFGIGEDEASSYETGDMVVAIVRAGEYKNEISFSVDGIRKLTDLSVELHHRAMILRQLKQLADEGKPLVLVGGGRVTNPADDASKFFTSGSKGGEHVDISEIELPVRVAGASKQETRYTSRLGDGESDGESGGGMDGGGSDDADDDAAGEEPGAGIEVDDDVIKGSIMDTITQPEFEDGITIAQLEDALAIDRKELARVLKIMAAEGNVEEIPSKPGTYRGK